MAPSPRAILADSPQCENTQEALLALLLDMDPQLAEVAEAWPELGDPIRQAIRQLVRVKKG